MTWVKLDDNFADHPKVRNLSHEAFRLHVEALCYCGRFNTDGVVQAAALSHKLVGHADELVAAGLWLDLDDGSFEVRDFLKYNPSKQKVEATREANRRRKELHSSPALVKAIRQRDGDHCRYCGVRVYWKDRRGAFGATYDHVDPFGDNTIDNLVVACRGCNSAKGQHTPEQVGMELLPPQNQIRPRSDSSQTQVENQNGPSHPTRPDPTRPEGSGVGESVTTELLPPIVSAPVPDELREQNLAQVRQLRTQEAG